MILSWVLVLLFVILILVYLNGLYNENYWKRRGVRFYNKNKVTGLFWNYLTEDRSFFQLLHDIYKEYADEPAVGMGLFLTPSVYVKDPANVTQVMQTDFNSFSHRGVAFCDDDKLAQNVLLLNGLKWKVMRQNLTPLFTTLKLKKMHYIMDKSAQDFVEFLKSKPDLKSGGFDICNSFCCAAITASIFGIGTDSTFNSPFIPFVHEALHPTFWKNIKFVLANLNASLFKFLGLSLFSVHEDWFINAIKQVIRQREKDNDTKKNDFADMCVTLQKNGTMRDSETGYELEPTDELLAAQAFFFFLAGLEPSASAMFSTLIELGRHHDMLKKVHEEIDGAFEKYNELTYDAIMEMQYLEQVLNESMRMYPPIGFLTRECVKDSVLSVGDIKIDKGTRIFTPIYEIHHDSNHYENPEVFNPERFAGEKISDASYMPFGKGNRICIGMRYAKLQVKTGLAHALRHFTVQTTVQKGGIQYKKQQVQVRMQNVDFEFIPRR